MFLNGGTLSSSGATWSEGNWIFNADVTVAGSAVSTISGLGVGSKSGGGTYIVGDSVTGSATDLLVSAPMVDASGGSFLTKQGPGTMELTATNTYTGTTTVSAGTLLVNGSTSTGAVNVSSGATLAGDGTIGGTVTIASGGTLSPGQ